MCSAPHGAALRRRSSTHARQQMGRSAAAAAGTPRYCPRISAAHAVSHRRFEDVVVTVLPRTIGVTFADSPPVGRTSCASGTSTTLLAGLGRVHRTPVISGTAHPGAVSSPPRPSTGTSPSPPAAPTHSPPNHPSRNGRPKHIAICPLSAATPIRTSTDGRRHTGTRSGTSKEQPRTSAAKPRHHVTLTAPAMDTARGPRRRNRQRPGQHARSLAQGEEDAAARPHRRHAARHTQCGAGDERRGGMRHQDPAVRTQAQQASDPVDRRAEQVAVSLDRRAGVDRTRILIPSGVARSSC